MSFGESPMPLPMEKLIEGRLAELELGRPELIERLGYKNISRGLRSLGCFCAGDFERYADLIPKLSGALKLDLETIETAVAKSREEIRDQKRKAWEEEERLWREHFQPHAVVVPERSVPSPIFVAGLCRARERMILALDRTRPRATFIRHGRRVRELRPGHGLACEAD
jgi:hypothetical protein